jgi:hypothetical protein
VAEQEGVRVDRMDLVKRVQELAVQNKTPADKLYKDLDNAGRLGDIASQILNEKVMDLLVQFARIQDVTLVPGA